MTKYVMPTDEEDAAITAAALSDPDAQPLTDEQLAQMRPGLIDCNPFLGIEASEGKSTLTEWIQERSIHFWFGWSYGLFCVAAVCIGIVLSGGPHD